jgi:hypothetical protein
LRVGDKRNSFMKNETFETGTEEQSFPWRWQNFHAKIWRQELVKEQL